jgi:hypothetical protein
MKDYSKLHWPTVAEATNTIGPIGRAMASGAKLVNWDKHIWMFQGKLVTEEFLEDYFRCKYLL